MGFEAPTHVQAQSIPVILSGRDVYPFVYSLIISMIVLVVATCLFPLTLGYKCIDLLTLQLELVKL